MDNKKAAFPVALYTLLIFVLIVVFEVMKSEVFLINTAWLSSLVTIIFVTLCTFSLLLMLKQALTRDYQDVNRELHNAYISAEAANQQLQAANEQLQSTEDELRVANDQLEQQRQYLDMLLQTIPEGIVRTDAKGKVLFCNKRILEETGLRQEEIMEKDIKNLVLPEDRPVFAKEFEKVFTQGMLKEISFHSRTGLRVLADVVVMKDKKGQVNGTLSAIKEFSKTGKVIEELDTSRQELKQKVEEMQLLHRTTMDREKRIIELKEQIETLKRELAKGRGTPTV
jgi:two-component system CheB/CheR fusion protein